MNVCMWTRRYLSRTELLLCSLPTALRNLPCGLGDERREREPVIVLVFLEIGECDEKESVEFRGILVLDNARPHLRARVREWDDGTRVERTSSATALNRAALSAALKSSIVL